MRSVVATALGHAREALGCARRLRLSHRVDKGAECDYQFVSPGGRWATAPTTVLKSEAAVHFARGATYAETVAAAATLGPEWKTIALRRRLARAASAAQFAKAAETVTGTSIFSVGGA
jgi:hypothetical protein